MINVYIYDTDRKENKYKTPKFKYVLDSPQIL